MKPDDAIRRVIGELVNAWNRADAGAFGGLITQDADYIGADGVAHHGRNAIEQLVQQPPRHVEVRIVVMLSAPRSTRRRPTVAHAAKSRADTHGFRVLNLSPEKSLNPLILLG